MVVDKLRAGYNRSQRKLSLQSEVDYLNFDEFMARHQIKGEKECLHCMVEYLNNITSKLVDGFHTKSNKIRYLLNGVFGKKCITTSLKNVSTVQYNFDQQAMALNESIQPECEIKKASTSYKTYYGQFTTHPKDVRKNDSFSYE